MPICRSLLTHLVWCALAFARANAGNSNSTTQSGSADATSDQTNTYTPSVGGGGPVIVTEAAVAPSLSATICDRCFNGDVSQTNEADTKATAENENSTEQSNDQEQSGGGGVRAFRQVGQHAVADQVGVQQAQLELVDDQRLIDVLLQQGQLRGGVVAYAEVEDLAALLKLRKGPGHLRRLHQCVGAMKQQNVEVAGAQAKQAPFHGPHDMLVAEVVACRVTGLGMVLEPDPALGLQHDVLARSRQLPEHLAEYRFGLATRVDVGVIEQGDALLHRRGDEVRGTQPLGFAQRRAIPASPEVHASVPDAGDREVGAGNPIGLHVRPP